MSRAFTSAEIIEKGDYLNPDFDPSSLTISQLLGVFGFHNINFPSPYTKGKLVLIFNDVLKPRIKEFKKERRSRQNSQASDEGIKDGLTGQPLNGGRSAPATRMMTRRLSKLPAEIAEAEQRPEPVKRRRSSAEPRLGGPSRKRVAKPAEPVVAEESEPEEPVRKVGRSKKKAEEAGAEARRVSEAFLEEGDSGWEDRNIFQSGAESSSPARPSPAKPRTRRSSAIPRRKSMSVPPQFAPPPSPTKEEPPMARTTRSTSVKPPEGRFDPMLPPEIARPRIRRTLRSTQPVAGHEIVAVPDTDEDHEEARAPVPVKPAVDSRPQDIRTGLEVPVGSSSGEIASGSGAATADNLPSVKDLDALSDAATDERKVTAVSQRIAEGGREVVRKSEQPQGLQEKPPFRLFLYRLLVVFVGAYAFNSSWTYKRESSRIGFCETGTQTNAILTEYRLRRALILDCNRENRTLLYPPIIADTIESVLTPTPSQTPTLEEGESQLVLSARCPPLPLIPLPEANTCEPCPAHATCVPSTMTCDTGYLLRPHPLLLFLSLPKNVSSPNSYTLPEFGGLPGESLAQRSHNILGTVLDGVPGLGPVAFPPRCVENPKRKRHIGALGKAMESMLAAERGRRLCSGVGWGEQQGTEAQEAMKWGMEIEQLKETMRKKTPPQMQDAFEDTFKEAVQQLIVWGGVFVGEDANGKRYLAHHTPSMDWTCVLKVKAREAWSEWQKQIIGFLCAIASIFAFRRRRQYRTIENDRVGELVQLALDMLRNQELAHHTDPVSTPQPYLSSLQLRDLVLEDVHSVGARVRLWGRVEAVVESNANVRTNLEEVEGGDEMRVWRWVGSAGSGTVLPLSPVKTPGRSPFALR